MKQSGLVWLFLVSLSIDCNGFHLDSLSSLFDVKIDVEGAIERFLNAVDEYYEVESS